MLPTRLSSCRNPSGPRVRGAAERFRNLSSEQSSTANLLSSSRKAANRRRCFCSKKKAGATFQRPKPGSPITGSNTSPVRLIQFARNVASPCVQLERSNAGTVITIGINANLTTKSSRRQSFLSITAASREGGGNDKSSFLFMSLRLRLRSGPSAEWDGAFLLSRGLPPPQCTKIACIGGPGPSPATGYRVPCGDSCSLEVFQSRCIPLKYSLHRNGGRLRFYTKEECDEWLKGRERVKPDTVEGLPSLRILYPSKSHRLYYFAYWMATELLYREPALLWITEWEIWGSCENWHLYYRLRQHYGDNRLLHEAPGHLFLGYEAKTSFRSCNSPC